MDGCHAFCDERLIYLPVDFLCPLTLFFLNQKADQKHVYSEQDQNSMLKVICNQRDRFRTRLRETEEVFCSSFCKYPLTFFSLSSIIAIDHTFPSLDSGFISVALLNFPNIVGNKAVEGEGRCTNSRTRKNKSR